MTDTSLLELAYRNDVAIIQRLVSAGVVDVNASDRDGYTALHVAIQEGHTGLVALLLALEASPNARTTEGHTPLFMLIGCPRRRQVDMIRLLTQHGADLRAYNHQGVTAKQYLEALGTDELRDWLNPDAL